MYIFKTSGETFESVISNQKHAFRNQPANIKEGDLIIVSKNKSDCAEGEKQIQYRMFVDKIARTNPEEIELYWPGNGNRWNYIVHCLNTVRLEIPFDLADLLGDDAAKFQPVQNYAKVSWPDEDKIIDYLLKTNPVVPNDYQPPVIADDLEELILEAQNYRPKNEIEASIILRLDQVIFPDSNSINQLTLDEWMHEHGEIIGFTFREIIKNRLYNNKGFMRYAITKNPIFLKDIFCDDRNLLLDYYFDYKTVVAGCAIFPDFMCFIISSPRMLSVHPKIKKQLILDVLKLNWAAFNHVQILAMDL